MDIIAKILILLKKKGVTQKELCNYLGISNNVFTDWKSGKNKSYLKYISKIADYFSVSVDYLLGNTDNKEKTSDNTKIVISDEDIKFALFNGNKEITDEMYEEVKQFAQFVVNRKKNGNNKDLRDSGK